MLVYRETTTERTGSDLIREIRQSLEQASVPSLEALLRASELECALADEAPALSTAMMRCSDALAEAWLSGEAACARRAEELLAAVNAPERLNVRCPEGYAFYALDPRGYAALASAHAARAQRPAAVLGIRSIGTSLSAVVRAELERHGLAAWRSTVRPTGHPWHRRMVFREPERELITRSSSGFDFIVVDEGPGLSGSTFLSVAEALVELGVPRERITLFCSHLPDPELLIATDAASRFRNFRCVAPAPVEAPSGTEDFSGGSWRSRLFTSPDLWPAVWPRMERLKYRSKDGRYIAKFSGYAPYDVGVRRRATVLSSGGWCPGVTPASPGFLAYPWSEGRSAHQAMQSSDAVPVLAEYIGYRAKNLPLRSAPATPLEAMTRTNVHESLGIDLPENFQLEVRSPVELDGRLMPHEWVVSGERWTKLDALDHAEDHLYPGPADVAWDLAGGSVEWQLDAAQTRALNAAFRSLTGDDVSARFPSYVVAYCAFRLGAASFAKAEADAAESARWEHVAQIYRARLCRELSQLGPHLGLRSEDLAKAANG